MLLFAPEMFSRQKLHPTLKMTMQTHFSRVTDLMYLLIPLLKENVEGCFKLEFI